MRVTLTSYTVADYCHQLIEKTTTINREYQRTDKVWPTAAKSYLIDTILRGFPIPKLSLYQTTDLRSRKTVHEVVDGQQRSMAILEFFKGDFALTGRTAHAGKRLGDLEDDDQQAFFSYPLNFDVFTFATRSEVREVFRRINSYNVPLNRQETRHAVNQGAFKWFIVDIADNYSQPLTDIGVFRERQLSRMADMELFAEIVMAGIIGITTASPKKLDNFYETNDSIFSEDKMIRDLLSQSLGYIFDWQELHRGLLMRPAHIYSLTLAIMHALSPRPMLQDDYPRSSQLPINRSAAVVDLSLLADSLESDMPAPAFRDFVEASRQATNTVKNRRTRFQFFSRALDAAKTR
jgi:hypothetical protein